MRDNVFLLIRVTEACLINFVVWGTLVIALSFKFASTDVPSILLASGLCLGCGIATWWIVRRLKLRYTRREVIAVAMAFAVVTPVALLASAFCDQVLGVYTAQPFDLIFRSKTGIFDAICTFISIAVTTTLLSYAVCVFVLWTTRRILKTQPVS
ncbi:MAG TPA: hypothetical protein VMQ60_04890 [Acidobacteriaceae bacterium]|jgi:hypothetical protein|nr:hypothetical protein [Acidobacteriaceae bacterium]